MRVQKEAPWPGRQHRGTAARPPAVSRGCALPAGPQASGPVAAWGLVEVRPWGPPLVRRAQNLVLPLWNGGSELVGGGPASQGPRGPTRGVRGGLGPLRQVDSPRLPGRGKWGRRACSQLAARPRAHLYFLKAGLLCNPREGLGLSGGPSAGGCMAAPGLSVHPSLLRAQSSEARLLQDPEVTPVASPWGP